MGAEVVDIEVEGAGGKVIEEVEEVEEDSVGAGEGGSRIRSMVDS